MDMACRSDAVFKNRKTCIFITAFFMLFFTPQICGAADVLETFSFSFENRWPDASVGNLAYDEAGNDLYLAAGNFLVILDADSMEEKSRLEITVKQDSGESEPPSLGITGIAADERGYVYAGCGPQGIAVIDVSDPDAPEIETTLAKAAQDDPIYGSGLDYDAEENFLYVADVYYGLRCIDVTNPDSPSQEWAYPQSSEYSEEDEISGGHVNVRIKEGNDDTLALVLDQYYGLRIFKVTRGSKPGSPMASFDMRSQWYWGQYSKVVDVAADDAEHAYVSDLDYGVTILDFSAIRDDGGEITNIGQIETPGTATGLSLCTDSQTLLVADQNKGMLAADVSDPEIAKDKDPPTFPEDLINQESYAATGSYAAFSTDQAGTAFLASGQEGLTRLEEKGDLEYGSDQDPYDPPADATALHADDEYAYSLDDDGAKEGLRIIRLKDEETDRPGLEGFIDTPGPANAVAVHGSFAYVADGTEGVAVIDMENKTSPKEKAHLNTSDAKDIKIHESGDTAFAYIADSDGLVIAEIDEDSGELTETETLALSGAAAVAVYERTEGENEDPTLYAAVAHGEWLTLADVTKPGSPKELGEIPAQGCKDVAVKYPHAVTAGEDGEKGIILFDISDPESPDEIDSFDTKAPAEALSLYGSYIHAAVGSHGVLALGITEKEEGQPELVRIDLDEKDETNPYFNTPGYASDVFAAERGDEAYTYVADTQGGFLILPHEDSYGEGINEQPFNESPDDSRRIECFISSLF